MNLTLLRARTGRFLLGLLGALVALTPLVGWLEGVADGATLLAGTAIAAAPALAALAAAGAKGPDHPVTAQCI
ncbi:hypothetical protein OFC87_34845, partial [Escherichia coli]|nr:hypothetical protein [Escherichia coli]